MNHNTSRARALLLATTAVSPWAAAATGEAGEALETIVVTALKRDTLLQDTPISISALTDDQLRSIGATSVADYYRSVPSMQVTETAAGMRRITLRGIQGAGEATVGLYYDETPLTGPSGTTADPSLQTPDINLFDVERVEILRGPQGTLYGSGSVGGTMRVIFAKPDATAYEGHAEMQATTTHEGEPGYYGKAAWNVPLVADKLAARAVAYHEVRGGYVDNVRYGVEDVNSSEMSGGRLMLRATPNEFITLTGTALYQKTHVDDNNIWYPQLGEQQYASSAATRTPFEDRLELYNLTLNWDLRFADMTATASHYDWDVDRVVDGTPSISATLRNPAINAGRCPAFAGQGIPCSDEQMAAYLSYAYGAIPYANPAYLTLQSRNYELRMSSKASDPLAWTLGGYLEEREDFTLSITGGFNPATGTGPLELYGVRHVGTNVSQTAVFGEISYKPADPLTLTVGARHYRYDKDVYGQVTQSNFIIASIAGPRSQVSSDHSGWVTKFNVSYQLEDSLLLYAQAAQGFRPGGANNLPTSAAGLVAYTPDELWTYEAGVKKSFAGGRSTLNAAVYRTDWDNLQAQVLLPPAFAILTNVGAARIDGIEVEGMFRLFDGLKLAAGFGYNDARLTEDQSNASIPATGGTARAGDRIPFVAKFTGAASAEYAWGLTPSLTGTLRADVNYRSNSFSEFRQTSATIEEMQPFATVNLRAGVEGTRWGAYVFVNNVFDRAGELRVQSQVHTPEYIYERQTASTTPRTIGLYLRTEF